MKRTAKSLRIAGELEELKEYFKDERADGHEQEPHTAKLSGRTLDNAGLDDEYTVTFKRKFGEMEGFSIKLSTLVALARLAK